MKHYTAEQYFDAGCMQFEHFRMGMGLYSYTNGMPCNDCPKNGECEAQNILNAALKPSELPKQQGETVKQEAARRGIGINAVRRERNKA